MVTFRTGYNDDPDVISYQTGLSCEGDAGFTQQHFKEECDINTIVRRFGVTGQLPQVPQLPTSAEFDSVGDFQTAMNLVRAAEQGFMTLPGELRARFGNDPGALLAFLEDDRNREEAVKLGLVEKPPEVVKTDVTPAP